MQDLIEQYDDITEDGYPEPVQQIGDEIVGLMHPETGEPLSVEDGDWSEDWSNYGDASPAGHGGYFVKWDPEHDWWTVVLSENSYDYGVEMAPEEYRDAEVIWCIEEVTVHAGDVWRDGDPSHGFTKEFQHSVKARHRSPMNTVAVDWVEMEVAHYARDFMRWGRGATWATADDDRDDEPYWDALESWGIEPEHA